MEYAPWPRGGTARARRAATTPAIPKLGEARIVGGYWDRTGAVEVDLVGMSDDNADHVAFVGSIKWRESRPFNHDDLAALLRHRDAVPGADDRTATVTVTRTGTAIEGITTFGPDLLLTGA